MNLFGNTTISRLETALDQSALTHRVIAQNIANIDTPNYKAKHVAFGNELQSAIKARRTDPRHFSFSGTDGNAKIVTENNTSIQNNGNNVDIDQEMTELAANQIRYQAETEAISRKFNSWNIVLGGGR